MQCHHLNSVRKTIHINRIWSAQMKPTFLTFVAFACDDCWYHKTFHSGIICYRHKAEAWSNRHIHRSWWYQAVSSNCLLLQYPQPEAKNCRIPENRLAHIWAGWLCVHVFKMCEVDFYVQIYKSVQCWLVKCMCVFSWGRRNIKSSFRLTLSMFDVRCLRDKK